MTKYKKVGGGSYGVYQPQPEPSNWGAIIVCIIVILMLVSCVS